MSLIGAEIKDVDGAAMFRRRLVTPFLRAGAATLACDHMPMVRDAGRRDAYGSVHKGNTLDGARIMLENTAPFGRHMRGVSYVFATKDRPGHLRANGRPGKTPGKTFMGTFVVDDSETFGPDFSMRFYAPKDDDKPAEDDPAAGLTYAVHTVIEALPDRTVSSMRMLLAQSACDWCDVAEAAKSPVVTAPGSADGPRPRRTRRHPGRPDLVVAPGAAAGTGEKRGGMTGPTDYPDAWKRGMRQTSTPAPAEAVALAIDAFIAALSY